MKLPSNLLRQTETTMPIKTKGGVAANSRRAGNRPTVVFTTCLGGGHSRDAPRPKQAGDAIQTPAAPETKESGPEELAAPVSILIRSTGPIFGQFLGSDAKFSSGPKTKNPRNHMVTGA